MYTLRQVIFSRYLKIAVDLAARIASGEIEEGEKLKGRSVLSTEYNVSPETIRRAMSILADKKVVEIYLGSGIVVSSREKAIQFVKSFKDDESLSEMRRTLTQLLESRSSIDEQISSITNQIIDKYKYMHTDLIASVEIPIPKDSHIIGKSISELEVWQNTGATIIGVVQDDKIIISPGPYYKFNPSDNILIVGEENVIERFTSFIGGKTRYAAN